MDSTAEDRLRTAIERTSLVTDSRDRTGVGHDDADDVTGTIASDDAIGFDPLPLLRALDQHGAEVVIIGQVAGILHGSTELTGDLDLLWSGNLGETYAMSAGFAEVGAILFDDDDRPVPTVPRSFELPKLVFRSDHASGDCCTPALPWGELDVRAFQNRAPSVIVDGIRLRYLCRDDLIAMRLAIGRPKDIRRATELQHLNPK